MILLLNKGERGDAGEKRKKGGRLSNRKKMIHMTHKVGIGEIVCTRDPCTEKNSYMNKKRSQRRKY